MSGILTDERVRYIETRSQGPWGISAYEVGELFSHIHALKAEVVRMTGRLEGAESHLFALLDEADEYAAELAERDSQ